MPCDDCEAARASNGVWRRFNNRGCIYCAARLIQRMTPALLGVSIPACAERRKSALQVAVEAGFDEAEVRTLSKGPLALEPLPEKEKKK